MANSLEPPPEKPRKVSNLRNLWYLIVLGFMYTIYYIFGAQEVRFFEIPSNSMEPTLHMGDRIITSRIKSPDGKPQRGDVVVFWDPKEAGNILVKRVIAFGGEQIFILPDLPDLGIEPGVYVNRKLLDEPYVKEKAKYSFYPELLKEGLFVLGDNRMHSSDSSEWNETVPIENVIGKVVYIYWPPSRFGPLKQLGS